MGAGAILGGLLLGRAAKLLTRVAIARLLGAASLGLYDLGWTIAYLLAYVTPLGLHTAVIRFGTPLWRQDRAALRRLIRRSSAIGLASGAVAATTLYLLSETIAVGILDRPELAWVLRTLALMIPLANCLEILAAASRATQRMRYTAYFRDLLQPTAQLVLFLALWALGTGLAGAVWAAVLSYLVAAVAMALAVSSLWRGDTTAESAPLPLGELLRFSLPVALASTTGALLMWVDRLIVGYYRPLSELGIYTAAAQLAILFALLLSALTTSFAPMFVDLWERRERERLAGLLRLSTRWGILLLSPIAAVFLVAPSEVLEALFGSEFGLGARSLRALTLGQMVNVVSGPVGAVLVSVGRQRHWMVLSATALGLNILLDIALVPGMGIYGAAIGSAVAIALLFSMAVLTVHRLLRLWPYDRRAWKLVLIFGSALLTVHLLRLLTSLPAWLFLIVASLGAGAAVLLSVLGFGLEPEDRRLLETVRRRLGPGAGDSPSAGK